MVTSVGLVVSDISVSQVLNMAFIWNTFPDDAVLYMYFFILYAHLPTLELFSCGFVCFNGTFLVSKSISNLYCTSKKDCV